MRLFVPVRLQNDGNVFKAGFIMALILAAIIGLLIWVLHITWKLLGKYVPNFRYYLEGF